MIDAFSQAVRGSVRFGRARSRIPTWASGAAALACALVMPSIARADDITYAGRRVKAGGSLAKVVLPQPQSDIGYNAANQLTRWGGKTLTYDPNGNLSNDGVNRYEWNEQNLLSQMSGAVTAAFSYDAFGRRRVRNVAGSPMNYFWDGDELNLAIPSGDWAQRSRLFSAYPDGGVDEQTLRRTGDDASQDRYFLHDGNNNVIALTDSDQQILTQYRYEPYGATTLTGAADVNTQQFAGRENDGTGLYYYRNRYYSPQTGRFISEDSIGYASGQTNAYAYVGGNPVQFSDPFGEAGIITGFTRHGLNRAINRGVSPGAMCDAVNNPISVTERSNGTTRYTGAGAVVVLNPAGRVVTVWGQ
ncbi:RHS repeat-associated core domain-containing protein [Paraburkholderia saeva]|uniref:RHS repeat-associated core domain-containing protein n=1 Tax=Paraburkholderia saeva TaxID=2777537 RepID=UPI001DBDD733|nr:RHS repeat-associated core domain-containing protein [Paraburkholderia saeva]CAG4913988.1 hypothetical protein R70241_04186 [Paraburkholderia saeva]